MKTFTRYVAVITGMVICLLALKVFVLVPSQHPLQKSLPQVKFKARDNVLWSAKESGSEEQKTLVQSTLMLPGAGEMGIAVELPPEVKVKGDKALRKYNVNVLASDLISLTRSVPDSRPSGCQGVEYPDDLPVTTIVIPFHNEWPSILMRTVYSIVNRTPRHLLKQIILVDDASDMESLKDQLDQFIQDHFPSDLVKVIRMPERVGLIRARLEGFRLVTSEVVSFMDSHMEVNVDWLQPLLEEVKKNPKTVAMGHLDYILPDTFEYSFSPGYRTRYGFDWRLIFFETEFLKSQEQSRQITDAIPGVVMVGPGFVIRSDYFREMGTYDEGMKIWGGENLELPWRIWLCGGRLVHKACSKLGHIARSQPYSFPEGRYQTELHNYKRAVEVWMGPYKKFVYQHHPKMKDLDVGDLTERKALRKRLKCKNFTWFLRNVWPELYPYGDQATHWGMVYNPTDDVCLDNNEYLFRGPYRLAVHSCSQRAHAQSFALTLDRKLRSVLQCVGLQDAGEDLVPVLINCQDEPFHSWSYTQEMQFNGSTWTYTLSQQLKHEQTGLCLQLMSGPLLVMQKCQLGDSRQVWYFETAGPPSDVAQEDTPKVEPDLPEQLHEETGSSAGSLLNKAKRPPQEARISQTETITTGSESLAGRDPAIQADTGPVEFRQFNAASRLKKYTVSPKKGPTHGLVLRKQRRKSKS